MLWKPEWEIAISHEVLYSITFIINMTKWDDIFTYKWSHPIVRLFEALILYYNTYKWQVVQCTHIPILEYVFCIQVQCVCTYTILDLWTRFISQYKKYIPMHITSKVLTTQRIVKNQLYFTHLLLVYLLAHLSYYLFW